MSKPSISWPAGHKARWPLVTVLALMLAGCAVPGLQSSGSRSVIDSAQGQPLGDDLNGFLAQAPDGAILNLATSPWGNQVEVTAGDTYFAASGRECRKLRVDKAAQGETRALACKTPQGWESRRLITETSSSRNSQP